MSASAPVSLFSTNSLKMVTFNAIGFGVTWGALSYLAPPHDFPRAAEHAVRIAACVWVALALAFAFHPWTSRLARPRFAAGVACSLGFAIAGYSSKALFGAASDELLGGGDSLLEALTRGAIFGLCIGLLFGSSIFTGEADASSEPDTE